MGKVILMPKKETTAEARKKAHLLAYLVFEYLPIIKPKASIAERRKFAADILLMCAGMKPSRLTPELMSQLIAQHSQCVADQQGRCYLTVFAAPLCWELNKLLGLGDEVDEAFRRDSEMTAAKPVGEEHFDNRED